MDTQTLSSEEFVIVILRIGIIFITLLTAVAFFLYTEELRKYRKLVRRPEDLLKKWSKFVYIEHPLTGKEYVRVFGHKFSSKPTLYAVNKDIDYLIEAGNKTHMSYFYDTREPIAESIFYDLLNEYQKKMFLWEMSKNREESDKPVAPYDFSELSFHLQRKINI